MEHKMHKASRQLPEDETLELLKRGDHGTLSVQGDDGYPYATPVNYIVVHDKALSSLPLPTAIKSSAWSATPSAVFRHCQHPDHPRKNHRCV